MDVIERISDGLRIPGDMLGLARRAWETPQALVVDEREAPQVPESEQQAPASLPGPDVDSILPLATRTSLNAATLEAFHSSIEHHNARRALDVTRKNLMRDSGIAYIDRVPVEVLESRAEPERVIDRSLRRLAESR